MSKMRQDSELAYYFNRSLYLEYLLLRKYGVYNIKKGSLVESLVKDFKKNGTEHIKDLNDKIKRFGLK